jgi:hypothetical protein
MRRTEAATTRPRPTNANLTRLSTSPLLITKQYQIYVGNEHCESIELVIQRNDACRYYHAFDLAIGAIRMFACDGQNQLRRARET